MSQDASNPASERADLEVFRFPDGEEFAKWEAKHFGGAWKEVLKDLGLASTFAFVSTWGLGIPFVITFPLIAVFLISGSHFARMSNRRIVEATCVLQGGRIEFDGRLVRQFSASGQQLGVIDTRRPVDRVESGCGSEWMVIASQGNERVCVSSALANGVRLCRDILMVGDPTRND